MANLENMIPHGSVDVKELPMGYAEKQLLGSYMAVDSSEVYDCETCNNCGSGDCSSCCGSTDD